MTIATPTPAAARRGRPPSPFPHVTQVRYSAKQEAAWTRAAKASGNDLGSWIRVSLDAAAKHRSTTQVSTTPIEACDRVREVRGTKAQIAAWKAAAGRFGFRYLGSWIRHALNEAAAA